MQIIGRKREKEELERIYNSGKPEFVAVYGRRRVGKTYLVREFFGGEFAFYLTGSKEEKESEQIQNFNFAIKKYSDKKYKTVKNWIDAFWILRAMLEDKIAEDKEKRRIVFIDEFPWLDRRNSRFLAALEHYWNDWASAKPQIVLIICGSSTSWIMKKIFKNRGGLHNRVTARISVSPFSLVEMEEFFEYKGIVMNRQQIIEAALIVGGIPYYLDYFKPAYSLPQNIDYLFFNIGAPLANEYEELYYSLFSSPGWCLQIIEALSSKSSGMTREEILNISKLPNGGRFTQYLEDLVLCGFVSHYTDFTKQKKDALYYLTDPFSIFYLRYVKNNKEKDEWFWTNYKGDGGYHAWLGLAFERLCMQHIPQIKQKLGIGGVSTRVVSWRSSKKVQEGAQIDIVIDRRDDVINLCEVKFTLHPYTVSKEVDWELQRKKNIFCEDTGTRKAIHWTMITTYGISGGYRSGIQSEVVMNDLFC
ncbi:MAG: ATP-binding protein [Lachnospiraceae bacterium]|nr:ATP-binding protein [Lachnospiraceae bacterium]